MLGCQIAEWLRPDTVLSRNGGNAAPCRERPVWGAAPRRDDPSRETGMGRERPWKTDGSEVRPGAKNTNWGFIVVSLESLVLSSMQLSMAMHASTFAIVCVAALPGGRRLPTATAVSLCRDHRKTIGRDNRNDHCHRFHKEPPIKNLMVPALIDSRSRECSAEALKRLLAWAFSGEAAIGRQAAA